jgi:nitrile hydratase subunit alpha
VSVHDHDGHEGHNHHDHDHAPSEEHAAPDGPFQRLERAVRSLLVEKGVLTAAQIARQIDFMESRTPALGARVVARAWTDAGFLAALRQDARAAVAQLGIAIPDAPRLVALENAPGLHNLVVCTLCSCYPRMLLGIPPAWYKSPAYRSRAVRDPRGVLAEFGVALPEGTRVRVSDSTADLRFLVVPERPAGTEGWDAERLAGLVTRDSMIGTGLPVAR